MENTEPKNLISEKDYEMELVIPHLAPMPPEMTHKHIEWALQEELLELEIETNGDPEVSKRNELLIWGKIKPVVKFIRQYKRMPNENDLRDYIDTQVATRTLRSGVKVVKTFAEHIKEIKETTIEPHDVDLEKVLKELGDLWFYVVAAGSHGVQYKSPTVDKAKAIVASYNDLFPIEEIRQANYEKLAGGENARYKNGYSVSEDLNRKNE